MSLDAQGDESSLQPGLRAFGLISLLAVGLLLPLDAHYRTREALQSLLLVYGLQIALGACILIAGGRATAPVARWVSRALVMGHAVALLGYLSLAPEHPGFVTNSLTCLLVAGAILFAWTGWQTLLVSGMVATAFLLVGLSVRADVAEAGRFWNALAGLAIGVTIATTCALVLTAFRTSLARRESDLHALSVSLMSAQEEERRRLSRELHDEFGQSLTAVASYLWLIERQTPESLGEVRSRAAEARQIVSRTLGEMRELSQLLCPPVLGLYGLVPSLETLCRDFGERHDIAATLAVTDLPERLPAGVETAVYRITQEALTNVARHAHAGHVRVALTAVPGQVRLEVGDDGVGISPMRQPRGIGLTGIGERVRALGGNVAIQSSQSSHGTRLLVSIPLAGVTPARAA
jgi:signal transduction histidine kinase